MQSSSENIKNCFIYYLFDDTLKEIRFIGENNYGLDHKEMAQSGC